MKRIIIVFICFLCVGEVMAQGRKYVSQFSHAQSYFNPALTGYEGSNIRLLIRNQWAGFEGAPLTYLGSLEFDIADFAKSAEANKHAFGLNILHDQYGPFTDTELIGSYSSRIRVAEKTAIRLGVGVNYNTIGLNGHNLTTEQTNDPKISRYLNSFANMQVLDFNVGISLTHPSYYLSYAVHDVNKGAISSGDVFFDRGPLVSVIQAGFRNAVSERLSLATNFMYRGQADLPDLIEFDLKLLMMDKFWLGAGHRFNYANFFEMGVLFPLVRIGYVYELPMNKSYLLPNTTHEFMAVFPIFRKNVKEDKKQMLIW